MTRAQWGFLGAAVIVALAGGAFQAGRLAFGAERKASSDLPMEVPVCSAARTADQAFASRPAR
ncbi:hypothetical protein M2323_001309 [Rhodoblastus acidophilus]|uniref:hypothetical protein n=1 Tax=Rhodoblastus acidophilus TaxID=1074 RepID=UPI0022251A48|nr:hypothetical protein [Rhodoblastus acidophilus]MCW2283537.1 hypothetical protein [Rhodoblastus acidophilus]MCW2332397.1 hypothetical protein [Rhodoblastus acidophilus]